MIDLIWHSCANFSQIGDKNKKTSLRANIYYFVRIQGKDIATYLRGHLSTDMHPVHFHTNGLVAHSFKMSS